MAQSSFFHYFPVPSFLRMPASGLCIDDVGARFVHLSEKDGTMNVDRYGSVVFPDGTLLNGEIKNAGDACTALSKLRKEHDLGFVRATISDDKVYLFRIPMPLLADGELRSALEFKIEENVPLSAAEALFDYAVVGRDEIAGKIDVVVTAIAKKTSESYVEVLRCASLRPWRLELESQAIAHAVVPREEMGTVLVAHFAQKKTGLYLVEGGVVQFSSTLPVEENVPNAPISLVAPASDEARIHDPAAAVHAEPQKYRKLALVGQEIDRILTYWHDTAGAGKDGGHKVLASGAETLDGEFISRFSEITKQQVEIADPWCNVHTSSAPPIPKEESFRYAAAIGTALANCTPSHTS